MNVASSSAEGWYRAHSAVRHQVDCFLARFLSRARFSRASSLRYASFGTLNIMRSAFFIRSASVSPGTAGAGFMLALSYRQTSRCAN